jgi:transcriptional regulator with XRE-family HTH domain
MISTPTSTADRIKKARTDAGLTQQQLADKVGVHVASPRNWEAGSTPRDAMMEKIAEACGVTADYLRDGAEDQPAVRPGEVLDLDALLKEIEEKLASHLNLPVERVKVTVEIS